MTRQAPKPLPPILGPTELSELLRERRGVRIVDVRTPAEFLAAHIEGAYNVPLETLHEHAGEIRETVSQPIVLLCQSGGRARKAEQALAEAGLRNLHVLNGGLSGWIAANLPVRRGRPTLSLERQVRIAAGALAATGGLLATFVYPAFGLLAAAVGAGLVFAGLCDTCGMAMLLARLPYNRSRTCDVGAVVRALAAGRPPLREQP